MEILVIICIILIVEFLWSPRLEYTRNKDLLLFYNNRKGRNYLKIL